jgi:hypothetical protein
MLDATDLDRIRAIVKEELAKAKESESTEKASTKKTK